MNQQMDLFDTKIVNEIIDDPQVYGSKGQSWDPEFVSYIKAIVTNPIYAGMPDAIKDDGKIQWEAPSNRSSGQYQNTHHKRRDWWRAKAESIGIDLSSATWISETAKKIHPTGEKPCKRCGNILRIAYSYPNRYLQRRINKIFKGQVECNPLEQITVFIQNLVDLLGNESLKHLPKLLSTGAISVPNLGTDLDEWLLWIEDEYIPIEPSLLSPGAMSNAPDRFDGFHSFNLCCRKKADTGRHDANMRSYSTDRRVFEYWSEGDWIAADRMMGIINATFRSEKCADGGDGPCSADHIGPLSLGFCHRPEFRLLSKAANSAKNNRMTIWDVAYLLESERKGNKVISWYAEPLWSMKKYDVNDEETALRLSKLLRDNQRIAMRILNILLKSRNLTFLASLLDLQYAEYKVYFKNLRVIDFVTLFDEKIRENRKTKYAQEQQARRLRIAFESLRAYGSKENRHLYKISDSRIDDAIKKAVKALSNLPPEISTLDSKLYELLLSGDGRASEDELRKVSLEIRQVDNRAFEIAKQYLSEAMTIVATHLNALWGNERYVRAPFDFESD